VAALGRSAVAALAALLRVRRARRRRRWLELILLVEMSSLNREATLRLVELVERNREQQHVDVVAILGAPNFTPKTTITNMNDFTPKTTFRTYEVKSVTG